MTLPSLRSVPVIGRLAMILTITIVAVAAWAPAQDGSGGKQAGIRKPSMADTVKAKGPKFIWSDDLALDNTVIFRHRVDSPPDGKARPDFSNLNNVVPEAPPRGGKRPPRK